MSSISADDASLLRLQQMRPSLAVLPWGATEAHNHHLPQGTDTIQASEIARRAVEIANTRGANSIVLPAIPFGNNAQQLDQVATIHLSTTTAAAILSDVVHSLAKQDIRKLVILNSHGGNEFKPLIRDLTASSGSFIAVINWWQLDPAFVRSVIELPGDHADELETSLILHLRPDLVDMSKAGPGEKIAFTVPGLAQAGVWTPRPWSRTHPDTGSGDPSRASAEKGKKIFDHVTTLIADLLVQIDRESLNKLP